MAAEVRYHMLRPQQIVERRTACPVAYIPIGTLEWHGVHNPLGADTLQAEGLALRCAERGGGLVFPPLYFGESRTDMLVECAAGWDGPLIAEQMQLPFSNFDEKHQPFSASEQVLNYHKLLFHILAEAQTLGFSVGVLVAGHYPLIDHARAAVLQFHQWALSRWGAEAMLAWACVDYLLVRDRYRDSGDHGGKWETSHVMALHPETVDLARLPPKGEKVIGVGSAHDPRESTAEFGRETLDAAVATATAEVAHRLANKPLYMRHGGALQEGLWRVPS